MRVNPIQPISPVKSASHNKPIKRIPYTAAIKQHLDEPAGVFLGPLALIVIIGCMIVACAVVRG